MIGDGEEDEIRFDWRRGGAAAAGLVAALILVGMVFLVKFANDAREQALDAERHSYEVALVVRNVSANVARSEAALARFVLDENEKTSGNIYASDWQLAGYQIDKLDELLRGSPDQLKRVSELKGLYVNLARPPATPAGMTLLRCSLCALHSEEQVGEILGMFAAAGRATGCIS